MSAAVHHGGHGRVVEDRLTAPADVAGRWTTTAYGILGVGLLGTLAGAFSAPGRFPFSYLTAFVWLTTIGLGALFFVILQHIVKAGWSVAPRRHAEWVSGVLPVAALLFVPLAVWAPKIWHHWWHAAHSHDELLVKKAPYLNPTFFFIRAAFYFAVWSLLSWWFAKTSKAQDQKGDPAITVSLQTVAPPSMLVFGLSLTFAAFDWLMSLDPHWYSTIFGVYVFAGSVVSALSVLCLINIGLQQAGLLGRVSTIEHRHDLGKLLFGFIVFWAYIGFSQYFLIWYANIPEETIFYQRRWGGPWTAMSMLLLFGHFIGPFAVLLSRHAKRSMRVLGGAASWMLFMHWIDIYWMVMPTLDLGHEGGGHHEASIGGYVAWPDIAALLLMVGVLATVIARSAARGPLFPPKDPRLAEARKVENL